MPKISKKGLDMPSSPIRKLVPYAIMAKEKGIHVIHLNIGQPDILSPRSAINAIKQIDLNVLEYSMSEGNESYREALTQYYHKIGLTFLDKSNFLATNGGSEALMITLASIADAGDEVIIPEPYYANYNSFLSAFDINVIPVISTIENNFSLPPIEEIEKKITLKTKAILLCNPNNPTGYHYSFEELNILKNTALKYDIFIIVDEVYREYVYEGKHHSILEFEELKNHAIVIDSESKRYSMCGIRLGFLVTRNIEVMQTVMKFAQARLSPPLLAQIAATAAHIDDYEYLATVKEEYFNRRNTLVKILQEIPGVKCSIPKGAFYCMAELPIDDSDKFAQWLLEKYQYNNQTLMLAPAGGFYSNPELGKKQVRIAYVLSQEKLQIAGEILKHALEDYKKEVQILKIK